MLLLLFDDDDEDEDFINRTLRNIILIGMSPIVESFTTKPPQKWSFPSFVPTLFFIPRLINVLITSSGIL